jgi:hypothetical protein
VSHLPQRPDLLQYGEHRVRYPWSPLPKRTISGWRRKTTPLSETQEGIWRQCAHKHPTPPTLWASSSFVVRCHPPHDVQCSFGCDWIFGFVEAGFCHPFFDTASEC